MKKQRIYKVEYVIIAAVALEDIKIINVTKTEAREGEFYFKGKKYKRI
jgi:hypothetical protein